MKPRSWIIWLASFSMLMCALDGFQHLMKARGGRMLLTIMKPSDQGFEPMQDAVREHYESLGNAALVVAAQAALIVVSLRTIRKTKQGLPSVS